MPGRSAGIFEQRRKMKTMRPRSLPLRRRSLRYRRPKQVDIRFALAVAGVALAIGAGPLVSEERSTSGEPDR